MLALVTRAMLAVAVAVAASWSGCGYRPLTARAPGGGERVSVHTVENSTSRGDIAGPLTGELRRQLARSGLNVVGSGAGAPALRVVIVAVREGPGMLGVDGDRLVPVDNVWEITAEASVTSADGEPLAEPVQITVDARSLAGDGVTTEQALGARARDELVTRLAREIVRTLFEE